MSESGDEHRYVMHRRADKQLSKLPESTDDRIQSKLKQMVENEWRDLSDYDVKQLSGTEFDIYRTRIGDYRVFFVIEDIGDVSLVGIIHVNKREGAYGNIKRLVERAKDFFSSD